MAGGDTTAVRKRFWEGDLLDFSGERVQVVVNPLLRVGAGNGWFENTRGARFEALIDSAWEVSGALEERQGIGGPLLSEWARATANVQLQTVVLPGWGRAKWTNPSTDTTLPIAFDASRATVHIGHAGHWGRLATRFETGLDHRHEGTAEHSLFWSRTAAPLPFVGGSLTGARWHAAGWIGSATGPDRGPSGATAESLFSRQRVTRLGAGLHKGDTFSTDFLYYRLARLPFTSESPATRHWAGAQATLHHGPWHAYLALAFDPAALLAQRPAYLGEHLHLRWQTDRTAVTFAYQRTLAGGYRALSTQIDLSHSGTPIASPWGDGLTAFSLTTSYRPFPRRNNLTLHLHAIHLRDDMNPDLFIRENTWHDSPKWATNAFASWLLQPAWNMCLNTGFQFVTWRTTTATTDLRPPAVTWCVGLSHKFKHHTPNLDTEIL